MRARGSYYRDKYYRLKARCGGVKAAMAIAHKILIAVFHMLVPSVLDSAVDLRIDDTATTESIRGRERDRSKKIRGKAQW
jgi:hypothetical protein